MKLNFVLSQVVMALLAASAKQQHALSVEHHSIGGGVAQLPSFTAK